MTPSLRELGTVGTVCRPPARGAPDFATSSAARTRRSITRVLRLPHARAEARVSEPHRGAHLGLESRRGVHPQREIQCTAAIKYHSCTPMRAKENAYATQNVSSAVLMNHVIQRQKNQEPEPEQHTKNQNQNQEFQCAPTEPEPVFPGERNTMNQDESDSFLRDTQITNWDVASTRFFR